MGAALFYHVTHSRIEDVVMNLAGRALQQGWKVELRGTTPERMAWLDEKLWQMCPGTAFLPHGLADGVHDDLQPILLTTGPVREGAGGAPRQAVLSLDGAEVAPADLDAHERVWILFDGQDPDAVTHARAQWKGYTGAGAQAQYWSEEGGSWQKKAES